MPSLVRRVAGVVCLATICTALPVYAQNQPIDPPAEAGPRVLSNFNFHMNAARIETDDERFAWDADLGGDVDLIDYGRGRVNFLADFETILGDELRAFDPNQGNYTLDVSASYRMARSEIALTFHHASRHLSDRPKVFPIAWNMLGVRFRHHATIGQLEVDLGARGFGTTQRSFVDYDTEFGGHVRLRYRLRDAVALLVGGEAVGRGVARAVAGRDAVSGGLVEGGLRFEADDVALEIFAAVERRIDADPIDRRARTWALVGFRLLSND